MSRVCFFIVTGLWTCLAAATAAAAPPELDFEAGEVGKAPADWFVPTPGWTAELTDEHAAAGKVSARLSCAGESTAQFGNLMRVVDAEPYKGRRVKLTARVRVEGGGRGQMWLRVDRANEQMGAFDNMGDRPLLPGDWTDAVIELDAEQDAAGLAIGFMSMGGATLYIDAVKLEVGGAAAWQGVSPARELNVRGLANVEAAARVLGYVRFFHPSDACTAIKNWDHFAVHLLEEAEPAADAAELAERLQAALSPIAPGFAVWEGGTELAPALAPAPEGATKRMYWRHMGAGRVSAKTGNVYSSARRSEAVAGGVEEAYAGAMVVKTLPGGVCCRVPVRVFADARGTLPHAEGPSVWAADSGRAKLTALHRSTRLAGVALCWGVMQHFYPYFDVVETDWDAALTGALSKAAVDTDEHAYWVTLNELVAKLHDGHGHVSGPGAPGEKVLPLRMEWAGDELVVVGMGKGAPGAIKVGDVVLAIDGVPLAACCEKLAGGISAATEGWRRYMVQSLLPAALATRDPCVLNMRHPGGGAFDAMVARAPAENITSATSRRPDNGAEVAPGIVYFDLNGAEAEALNAAMTDLQRARGIVFDLRGYPGGAGYELMQHLIDEPATSARWTFPIVTLPDREGVEWVESGRWQLRPVEPRLEGKIAFLTDGRAISYAESVMGIVEAYKLGEIVGATTAGTNGNVNPFELPGGYSVSWTGMKVLKHDRSRHHGVGIKPTVAVEPTAKGIAAGRDEVLERAVEVLRAKLGE